MSSSARKAFDANCIDIDRLLEIHSDLAGSAPGRKYRLEALNKSAIVLVTAFWEAYCEDLAAEALQSYVLHAPDSSQLPVDLRKSIAKELANDKNELAVWDLSGDGWRSVLKSRFEKMTDERNRRLNTPKSVQIDELFSKTLGINKVSSSWRWQGMTAESARTKLDDYVALRGSIAHRGSASSGPVHKGHVQDYYYFVKRIVGRTGGRINSVSTRVTGKKLW